MVVVRFVLPSGKVVVVVVVVVVAAKSAQAPRVAIAMHRTFIVILHSFVGFTSNIQPKLKFARGNK